MSKTLVKSADLEYYSFDRVFSYNAGYNFIVGARGLGKTYGAKQHVIRNAIRKGEQFIYLRRYKSEIKGAHTFFADIQHEFPEWDLRVNGSFAEMAPVESRNEKKRKWRTIGYFVALSNAQAQKSVAYPLVTTILFDEFIIEKGMLHYLPNEAKALNDFYLTVDRWKDKTRVLFLANSLTITNPYFLEYDIMPERDGNDQIIVKKNGFLVAHFPDSAAFSKGVFKTRFGQFIEESDYANYAVGNEFADNHDHMLGSKGPRATYHMTIEGAKGIYSVWVDWHQNNYFIQEKRPKQEVICTLLPSKMSEGKRLLLRSDKRLQYLRAAFSQGRIWFDTPRSRNAFIDIFKG